jgi:hypothetical protein
LCNFSRLNLFIWIVYPLFTQCQSLHKFCCHQIVVSITVGCPEQSDIKYTWMLPVVYRNMVTLIMSLSIRRYPSKFMFWIQQSLLLWPQCHC